MCPKKKTSVIVRRPRDDWSCGERGVSKVCSAPVEIGSGNVLLLRWRCAPSGGRSPSEDAELEKV